MNYFRKKLYLDVWLDSGCASEDINANQETKNAQKMTLSIKNFFSKCDQIRRKLRIWSHLLKKSLMQNFIFVQWEFF